MDMANFDHFRPSGLKGVAISTQATQAQNPYSLSGLTLARFREAFGEPNLSIGHDFQWTLKTSPFGIDIHVLVNGTEETPVVWIFDPNDRADGVTRSVIEQEDAIVDVVDHVRDRVSKACKISHKPRDARRE
jgi:hypothetical protein